MTRFIVRARAVVASCVAIVAATAIAAGARTAPVDQLGALASHHNTIVRAIVYAVPGNISTLIAVTPQTLETFSGVRKRVVSKHAEIDALIAAIRRAKASPDAAPFDARFGVVFEDRSGVRRFSMYTNSGASRGTLDGKPVAFDDPEPLFMALQRASR